MKKDRSNASIKKEKARHERSFPEVERLVPLLASAVILAAGESRRMGQPKLLMSLGGNTILGQTLDNFAASITCEVIVVVGYKAEEIRKAIRSRPVKVVENRCFRDGMASSLGAGIGAAREDSTAFVIALGDEPFIHPKTIDYLIRTHRDSKKGIALPAYQGRRGHPVLFGSQYRDELLGLKGDVGAREVISRHPDDVLEVDVNDPGVIQDIDTQEAYERLAES